MISIDLDTLRPVGAAAAPLRAAGLPCARPLSQPAAPEAAPMANRAFSRAYLQALPEATLAERMDDFVRLFQGQILTRAKSGFTSAFIDIDISQLNPGSCRATQLRDATEQDVVAAFQRRFPDCDVRYAEEWIEIRPNVKEFKKGILVDWS